MVMTLVVSTLAALGTTAPATADPVIDPPQPWHLPLSLSLIHISEPTRPY